MQKVLLVSLVSVVFLLGCLPADDGGGVTDADRPVDDPQQDVDPPDDRDLDDAVPGHVVQDDNPDDEPDEPEEPEEPLGWDPSEPDVPDGTTMETHFVCGLMQGAFDGLWVKQDGQWQLTWADGQPVPELIPCAAHGAERWFEWEDDGTVHFVVGGIEHLVEPTEVENRWMGSVWSAEEPSDECLAGLEQLGLEFPLTLQMNVVAITPPTS